MISAGTDFMNQLPYWDVQGGWEAGWACHSAEFAENPSAGRCFSLKFCKGLILRFKSY